MITYIYILCSIKAQRGSFKACGRLYEGCTKAV